MRIGVTLGDASGLEGDVCAHFGQCSHFLIADVKDGKLADTKVVANEAVHGGGGCLAVDEILKFGVTHVISGGMGIGAQQKFAQGGIPTFGYSGKVKDAIKDLLNKGLGGIDACAGHDHA
ncbi:MAG: NifB/NifX family molybdenum-iron cluster-binding protein [Candidatus Margulisiibacteriota bacterium]